jgi:hypothetical protein
MQNTIEREFGSMVFLFFSAIEPWIKIFDVHVQAKGREPKGQSDGQSRKPHQYFLRGSMSALSFPKLPGDVKD